MVKPAPAGCHKRRSRSVEVDPNSGCEEDHLLPLDLAEHVVLTTIILTGADTYRRGEFPRSMVQPPSPPGPRMASG